MEGICKLRFMRDMGIGSHGYLWILYEPLMGGAACQLYEILCVMGQTRKEFKNDEILSICRQSQGQFENSRKKLEQFLLLSTFCTEDKSRWEYRIYPPMSPEEFLRHDVFGRMLLNDLSSSRYEQIKQLFDLDQEPENMNNVSAAMNENILDEEWSLEKETVLQMHLPNSSDLVRYPFDWDVFFKGMDRTFPKRLRSKENMARIAQLGHMYGMDEAAMRIYVARSVSKDRTAVDFDYLITVLQHSKKSTGPKVKGDIYTAAPIQFLQSIQPKGVEILPSERKLLASLSQQYKFSDEVINELLAYCLEQCSHSLNEKYIKKTAATWARANIDTRQKAQSFIAKGKSRSSKVSDTKDITQLPEWYANTEKQKPTQELNDEILEIQRQLRGEKAE